MKNLVKILIVSPLLLFSCGGPQRLSDNHQGKFGYEKIEKNEAKKVVEVFVNYLPSKREGENKEDQKKKEEPKTFFDLRDSIPHTFLRVIGNKAQNIEDITKAMKEPLSKTESSGNNNSKTPKMNKIRILNDNTFKAQILISNIKNYYLYEKYIHPNTRLEFLRTEIEIDSPKLVEIVSIDRLENEFENIDLGTIDQERKINFNSKLTGEFGRTNEFSNKDSSDYDEGWDEEYTENRYDDREENPNLTSVVSKTKKRNNTGTSEKNHKNTNNAKVDGEIGYSSDLFIKEALELKFKRVKTSFSFDSEKIIISQRGSPLNDITDNILINATLRFKNDDSKSVWDFSDLFDKEGKPNSFNNIKVQEFMSYAKECNSSKKPRQISLSIKYEGAIRAVRNLMRGKNILEFDDKVIYYYFDVDNQSDSIKIPQSEFCKNFYQIVAEIEEKGEKKDYILGIKGIESGLPEAILINEKRTNDILTWLSNLIKSRDDYSKFKFDKVFVFYNSETQKEINLTKKNFGKDELEDLKKIKKLKPILNIKRENNEEEDKPQ